MSIINTTTEIDEDSINTSYQALTEPTFEEGESLKEFLNSDSTLVYTNEENDNPNDIGIVISASLNTETSVDEDSIDTSYSASNIISNLESLQGYRNISSPSESVDSLETDDNPNHQEIIVSSILNSSTLVDSDSIDIAYEAEADISDSESLQGFLNTSSDFETINPPETDNNPNDQEITFSAQLDTETTSDINGINTSFIENQEYSELESLHNYLNSISSSKFYLSFSKNYNPNNVQVSTVYDLNTITNYDSDSIDTTYEATVSQISGESLQGFLNKLDPNYGVESSSNLISQEIDQDYYSPISVIDIVLLTTITETSVVLPDLDVRSYYDETTLQNVRNVFIANEVGSFNSVNYKEGELVVTLEGTVDLTIDSNGNAVLVDDDANQYTVDVNGFLIYTE